MPSLKQINSRTKTVKQISKITKAMQMVSASRIKKAQDVANSSIPYSAKLYQMMHRLKISLTDELPTNGQKMARQNRNLILYFSTQKGLVGGLNSNVRRILLASPLKENADYIAIGKKGARQLSGIKANVVLKFDLPKAGNLEEFLEVISKEVASLYGNGTYSKIYLLFPKFITTSKQIPEFLQLIPLGNTVNKTVNSGYESYLFEPKPEVLYKELVANYLEIEILNAIYSTEASEQSARMVAMKNATDNAIDLAGKLTHIYNVKRQQKITTEILELSNK